jgi:hypothetical protein
MTALTSKKSEPSSNRIEALAVLRLALFCARLLNLTCSSAF